MQSLIQDMVIKKLVRLHSLCDDHETEKHAHRVAAMTEDLARICRVPKAERVNMYRGALLHDIGKIALPSKVLKKEGPLTEEEYATTRKHPGYAYEYLYPVSYLRPALVIPYCHHEKWDGTGYPRRLKGSQIPFAARLFAVVDTWDALLSDRPYRPAWSVDQAREYMFAQSGKSFEPRIVTIFVNAVDHTRL